MFGVDASGASVAAFVHGFDPYFYVEAPPGFGPDDCDGLCRSLNVSQSAFFFRFWESEEEEEREREEKEKERTDKLHLRGTKKKTKKKKITLRVASPSASAPCAAAPERDTASSRPASACP